MNNVFTELTVAIYISISELKLIFQGNYVIFDINKPFGCRKHYTLLHYGSVSQLCIVFKLSAAAETRIKNCPTTNLRDLNS